MANDRVTIRVDNSSPSGYAVNLGAGDDVLRFNAPSGPVILGPGRDTIEWTASSAGSVPGQLIVQDFQTGDTGDIFDLRTLLQSPLAGNYQFTILDSNPFATGQVEMRQVGSDVVLVFHAEATLSPYSEEVFAVFRNTNVAAFTSANFGGYDPHAVRNWPTAVTGDLTIVAGETRGAVDVTPAHGVSAAFVFAGQSLTLTNHGTINSLALLMPGATGFSQNVYYASNSTVINASDGHVFVRTQWIEQSGAIDQGRTYGIYGGVALRNDGQFEVSALTGRVYGHYGEASFTNNGLYRVSSGFEAYGVYANGPDLFVNTGTIDVYGDNYAVGLYFRDARTGFTNAGSITVATNPRSPYASVGIYLFESVAPTGRFDHYNSGTITADVAIDVRDYRTSTLIIDYLHNSGAINGDVYLGKGNDVVDNSGSMSGATFLGEGNDVYLGTNGRHNGTVEGGSGNDQLTGGAFADSLYGDEGNDILVGGGGNDLLSGGLGSDRIDGGAGIDTVSYEESPSAVDVNLLTGSAFDGTGTDILIGIEQVLGSWYGDRITGSTGADTIRGLGGNDRIDGGGGDDVLAGDKGDDVITTGPGSDTIIFQAGDGRDLVTDFTAGDSVHVYGYGAAQTIVQSGSSVILSLSSGDQITFANTNVASVQGGLSFTSALFDLPARPADRPIMVVDEQLVIANGVTIQLADAAAPSIDGSAYPAAVLLASTGGAPSLANAGSITVTDSGASGLAIGVAIAFFEMGSRTGYVENFATGVISVHTAGADATGFYAITNARNLGTVRVTSDLGNATGFSDVGDNFYHTESYNGGLIDVSARLRAVGIGQSATTSHSCDRIFNDGIVSVHGGIASVGSNGKPAAIRRPRRRCWSTAGPSGLATTPPPGTARASWSTGRATRNCGTAAPSRVIIRSSAASFSRAGSTHCCRSTTAAS